MAHRTGDYIKQYRKDDPVTGIGYKIIYNRPEGRYEIYTQFPYNKKNLRNKIRTPEVIKRENNLEELIDYVENAIIVNHVRFYENGVFNKELGTRGNFEIIKTEQKADMSPNSGAFEEAPIEEVKTDVDSVDELTVVYHKVYGRGTIIQITEEKIYVMFGNNQRIFPYPEAFEKEYLLVEME